MLVNFADSLTVERLILAHGFEGFALWVHRRARGEANIRVEAELLILWQPQNMPRAQRGEQACT